MDTTDGELVTWSSGAQSLNAEFGGQTLLHCAMLNGGQFAVIPDALKVCGSATHQKGSPLICEYSEPRVNLDGYFTGLAKIIRENQLADGPCVGCRNLGETQIPRRFVPDVFNVITLHDFSGCNSACVYCAGSEYWQPVDYVAAQEHETLFRNLKTAGLIKRGATRVEWGGGEPTLVNTFDRAVEFLSNSRIHQVINTSGIRFSPQVEAALLAKTAMVRVSVDAGTEGIFEQVKRNPHFDDVWETIGRYSAAGGDFVVKYIIFDMNSALDEVEAFVSRCAAAGVKRICISVDARSVWTGLSEIALTDKEFEAAARMRNVAKSKGIHAYFESIWSTEHLARIGEIGGFDARVGSGLSLNRRLIERAKRELQRFL